MRLGKVIGRVVSTRKVESFEGKKLMLVQPLDENFASAGDAFVALDTIQSDIGNIVYYETSKEAGRVLVHTMNPCDAAIMAIVDAIHLTGQS